MDWLKPVWSWYQSFWQTENDAKISIAVLRVMLAMIAIALCIAIFGN